MGPFLEDLTYEHRDNFYAVQALLQATAPDTQSEADDCVQELLKRKAQGQMAADIEINAGVKPQRETHQRSRHHGLWGRGGRRRRC